MKIYIKKVEGVSVPTQGTKKSTGYDIVAISDPKIVGVPNIDIPDQWDSIDYIQYETGLYLAPPTQTHDIKIYPRSSIRKYNLTLANSVPIIDNDYRGQLFICFKYQWQPSDFGDGPGKVNMEKIYQRGDKIAQMVLDTVIPIEFVWVDTLDETDRGAGGFGSTDMIQSGPLRESNVGVSMADKFREANYVEPTHKKYEDVMREAQKDI